jgi:hypothetical protein
MKSYEFVLASLGVWRLTHLLTAEDGPFDLIARLRKSAGSGFWGSLMDCFYCLSLWIAAPFALGLAASWRERVLLWPALSGAAILIQRFTDRVAPETPVFFEEPPSHGEGAKR